jgi:hypothetical protein
MNDDKWIETYKKDLKNYSLEQLRYISEAGVWSLGQMYNHVILVALEYLEQVEACAAQKEEQKLGKTEFAERMFQAEGFPPIKIKLPDELNAPPNNPDCKEDLMRGLHQIMEKMRELEGEINVINPNYKVQHGGFGWLNAKEWYELVSMHSRHHLRQKHEIEQKLGIK